MHFPKRKILLIGGIIILGILLSGGYFYWKNLRGIAPLIKPSEDITKTSEISGLPLKHPAGFSISIFAKNLPGARVMVFDALGNMWVSQTSEGKISLLEVKDGKIQNQYPVFKDLKNPHGLAFDPQNPFTLYFAEENKISRVRIYSEGEPEKIADLPSGGGHFTRTIGFGPDERLYVSIGSSCNVCEEKDSRRAKIFSLTRDGSNFREFARGLRNAVFFTWSGIDERMWVTEMGRDFLGDDLPPDEINIVEGGKDYGWPYCYGRNIPDPFGKDIPASLCLNRIPSHIDIPAHSAPLGLAFIPKDPPSQNASEGQRGWPRDYWYNLIVAYHGSWNRSEPIGYKVVRFRLDKQGNYLGVEDFITGWLKDKEVLGRPVDILIQPGVMYISDDKAGVIYKVVYEGER